MIIVLDTSAAFEILLRKPQAPAFRQAIGESEKVITSTLYQIEVANTLGKYVRGGYLTRDQAGQMLPLAQGLIDEFTEILENNTEALHESIRLNHSAYDMLYLTLARRTGATLLTLDKKLIELANQEGIPVIPEVANS
jgi:predicted nucleic acid-binding protein